MTKTFLGLVLMAVVGCGAESRDDLVELGGQVVEAQAKAQPGDVEVMVDVGSPWDVCRLGDLTLYADGNGVVSFYAEADGLSRTPVDMPIRCKGSTVAARVSSVPDRAALAAREKMRTGSHEIRTVETTADNFVPYDPTLWTATRRGDEFDTLGQYQSVKAAMESNPVPTLYGPPPPYPACFGTTQISVWVGMGGNGIFSLPNEAMIQSGYVAKRYPQAVAGGCVWIKTYQPFAQFYPNPPLMLAGAAIGAGHDVWMQVWRPKTSAPFKAEADICNYTGGWCVYTEIPLPAGSAWNPKAMEWVIEKSSSYGLANFGMGPFGNPAGTLEISGMYGQKTSSVPNHPAWIDIIPGTAPALSTDMVNGSGQARTLTFFGASTMTLYWQRP